MAWSFGDGFDLYTAPAEMLNGYWDSGTAVASLVAGRFSGSRGLSMSTGHATTKNSGANDVVHHFAISIQITTALSGTSANSNLQLFDGATAQCSVVFRSDGAILLTSGGPTGTTLATYAGAITASSTWYQFEFEIVINNTTGSFKARKNGNNVDDFSAAALDTQNSANAYANKLVLGWQTGAQTQFIDDLFWKSDASSVAWMGDIRCYTRMPASDSAVAFSRTPTSNTQTPVSPSTTNGISAGTARYTTFTAAYDGSIGTATVSLGTGYTGNLKASIFADASGLPTTVLGSANVVVNPITGPNTCTFATPVAVVKGVAYWIGWDSDTTSGTWSVAVGGTGKSSTTAYASFPTASPATSSAAAIVCSLIIGTTNYTVVNEAQQDALTSYVYDSTPGDADFYGIASITSTPATVIACTTRAYMQKSDAGTRTAAVQVKSGATTVASPTVVLTTSGWQWLWRTDVTDPATGAAWTPAAVNNVTIGPKTVA